MFLLVSLLHFVGVAVHEIGLLITEVDRYVDKVNVQHIAVVVA